MGVESVESPAVDLLQSGSFSFLRMFRYFPLQGFPLKQPKLVSFALNIKQFQVMNTRGVDIINQ